MRRRVRANACRSDIWSAATVLPARCARSSASKIHGISIINRSVNVMFSAPALWEAHDKGKAGRYVIIGEEGAWASLTPADGTRTLAADDSRRSRHGSGHGRCRGRGAARDRPRHRLSDPQSWALGAPSDGGGSLWAWSRLSRRGCGPRHAAERRPRHEHRHRRRRRSRLEACRGPSRLGRAGSARKL